MDNMSIFLRIEMIVIALGFMIYVINSINKRKLLLQYSLIWFLVAGGIVVVAFFPDLLWKLADLMHIEVPSNLLYLLAIIVLLIICFKLTVIVSKQSEKIKYLIQIQSIENYLNKEKGVKRNENNENSAS